MKYVENIQQVADLNPDYLGFIFYEKSKRNFEGIIPEFSNSIQKTGVFVNEYIEIVISLVEEYRLDAIQLHGDESVDYIVNLKKQLADNRALFIEENKQIKKKKNQHYISKNEVEIIKVFGIKDEFNFDVLQPYLDVVDFFLFDTKGKERGGNGTKFDWSVLEKYPFDKPFFLSGGIGLEDVDQVKEIFNSELPIYALDINSKFEVEPGRKKIEELQEFKKRLNV
ncbi:phosphoribosylanthranilate isomerase [Polaribacter reichenbachii]|uniref:N-(5'-phosphoribosyl)anthranilate isomerase n=2 Tax=Polaribacter reichenbachii TaxID=996801 RepID=A0A1B8TVS9_9FLAO|nr:phosphoribosylanthranilate isomerase [Polaribacter reichenbachii]OBY63836.1 N-(5'-phosphoribosyl)anthranilate isomerase [Polaribacter reichenbachii]